MLWLGLLLALAAPEPNPQSHWAFQPVRSPEPPAVNGADWCRTGIDRFILSRLETKGLTPSRPASPRTLIRRLKFDLLGLPPTPEEVAAYEADTSPEAYTRLVDRLLASPHYGERWGRHWLDVARYADTKGYVFFEDTAFPWAYTYRDYVIEAFNEDLPYNQFVLEQIAADQLEAKPRAALRGLGFLTLGGRFMNIQQDILDDRIDVVTRGLMGLTVSCARCHDHKFDPISTRDYYALYGVFASADEPTVPPLFTELPRTEAYAAFEKELKSREEKLAQFVQKKHAEVVQGARDRVAEYLLAAHELEGKPSTDQFMIIADGKDLNPRMLRRWRSYLVRSRRTRDPVFLAWHLYAALPAEEFAAKSKEVAAALTQPGHHPSSNPLVTKAFVEKPPATLAEVAQRYGAVLQQVAKSWHEASAESAKALADPAQEELRQVLYGPDAPASIPVPPQGDLDLFPDRPSQDELKKLLKAVEEWRVKGPGAPPRAMTLEDLPTPVEQRVFVRGNPSNLGEPVQRRFLELLAGPQPQPFQQGSGRLELAKAIIDPKNPLTARVLVNRVWLHHFGEGLVRTPSDFGLRSDRPSHPELLDHLASDFSAHDWSIKHLHRQILLSATYQQDSADRPDCRKIDPENMLLWRMNRRRLDFEATRDALLAVSGGFQSAVGGPSVKDPFGSGVKRRTMYALLDRLNVPGLFRTFDFPNPDTSSPRRDTAVVAPQALFLMNHPFVGECARRTLQRQELAGHTDLDARVQNLYVNLFGRPAASEEAAMARGFLGSDPRAATWEHYVQALLLSNEFVIVD
jgi:hypothetical protein